MNTFDWLTDLDIQDPMAFKYVEVSFKKGSRKSFYINDSPNQHITGDLVVVEAQGGYDLGRISLSGELVRAQMKKKRVDSSVVEEKIVRQANSRDLEKLGEARSLEKGTMVKGRAIARTLDLDLKLGDVIYRGDKRKATFYYTANGRIDFRELVRNYAKEFRVKVEMKQIGARQESAIIGGLGACGRELCCSTWLSDFKSVSTAAARYQNISINHSKLSGQCGRLKCCLNYELDTYMDALEDFPKKADYIHTKVGKAQLLKTDIFKKIMYYAYVLERGRSPIVALDVKRVKEILKLNAKGSKPDELVSRTEYLDVEEEITFAADEMNEVVELPSIKKRRNNKKRNNRNRNNRNKANNRGGNKPKASSSGGGQSKDGNRNQKKDGNKGKSNKGQSKEGNKGQNREGNNGSDSKPKVEGKSSPNKKRRNNRNRNRKNPNNKANGNKSSDGNSNNNNKGSQEKGNK
jgi:cell fate regulator YaaT (PSP1 superfamily)